jgi:hypothetical protein
MDDRDPLTLVRHIGDCLEGLVDHEPLGPRERIDLWVSLHEMGSAFRAALTALEEEAVEAALELSGGERKVPVRTRFATVVVKRKPTSQRTNGWQLLEAISSRVVDPATGETEQAVPVRLLRAVVPACGVDDFTSARFNLTALRGHRLQLAGQDVELDELVQTGGWRETIALAGPGGEEP